MMPFSIQRRNVARRACSGLGVVAVVPIVLLGGCWKTQSADVMFSTAPEYAHYVIVDRGASSVRVLDCMSMPDGVNWDPQCIRVDRPKDAPPTVERTQPPLPNLATCD